MQAKPAKANKNDGGCREEGRQKSDVQFGGGGGGVRWSGKGKLVVQALQWTWGTNGTQPHVVSVWYRAL